jgi:glycosyltransferase involved in cell wall biosynthesis
MTNVRVVHLLDDFSLGGVTNGVKIFDHPKLAALAQSESIAVEPNDWFAPKLEADIILIHFPPRWRGLPFLRSLRRRNPHARIIHVEHSYSREWAALYVAEPHRFRTMLKLAFGYVDDVIAVSHAQAKWLIELGTIDQQRLSVIYPFSQFQGLESVAPLSAEHSGELIVGSFGRFADAKGYDRLIDAFKAMDDLDQISLVLGGFGSLENELHERASGCDRISFVGKVTDTAKFMQGIHVFAVPSRYETFGQVATEARQAARPLLVSTVGGLPEQVGDAGIIVDCQADHELLWSLRALHTLPLSAMGERGRNVAAQCIERRIAAWEQLLTESIISTTPQLVAAAA